MGYVHFVRAPYAHAKIVSVDVSAAEALEGVYGTLDAGRGRRADRPVLRADDRARRARSRTTRSRSAASATSASRSSRSSPQTRELARDAADLVEVEYEPLDVIVDARTAQDEAPILHEDAGTNVVWSGTFDWGDVDGALKAADQVVKIKELHFDRFSSTPLECSAALVEYERGTGQFTIHCNHQMPGRRRDLDGAGAARAARQAPLRHAGHRRRLRQQDHDAHVADRLLPARAQAEAADPVDGVAHRPAHRERARQRALVPRHRGRRPERRHDARLQGQGARRLRRVPALRAARLHHLGAGHARPLPLAEHPRRLHAGRDEQVAGGAEPRLLADAAALADRADLRHRRARARARPGRGAEEELREDRGDAVRDAERLRLRLGRLRALPRHRARADRLRRRPGAAGGRQNGKLVGIGIGSTLDSGTNNFGQSTLLNPELQFSGNNEVATIKLDIFGEIVLTLGTVPQGQGHETVASQVAADILGVSPDQIHVRPGHDSLLELARRLLRHVREPVRGHRARGGQGRGREALARDPPARGRRARRRRPGRHRPRGRLREDRGQPGGGAPVHGLRRDHQREQRGAPARAARHHAQLPPRLRAAVRDARLRDASSAT